MSAVEPTTVEELAKLSDRALIRELLVRIIELHRRTHPGVELDPAGVVASANDFITAHDPAMSNEMRAQILESIAQYLREMTR